MNQQESNNLHDLYREYSVKEGLIKLEIISGNGHQVEHDIFWEDKHYDRDNLDIGLGSEIKSKSLRITSNCLKTSPSESVIITYKLTGGDDESKFEVPKKFDTNGRTIVKAKFKFK